LHWELNDDDKEFTILFGLELTLKIFSRLETFFFFFFSISVLCCIFFFLFFFKQEILMYFNQGIHVFFYIQIQSEMFSLTSFNGECSWTGQSFH
jgi:hypothetical protein